MAETAVYDGGVVSADSGAYGGFWVRVLAYSADMSIVTLALLALAVPFLFLGGAGMFLYGLLASVAPFAYFAWFTASPRQSTPGKQLCGLKVRHAGTGERISLARSLARELAKVISAAVLFLGFVIVGLTQRKQGLHDMLAMTVVVREGPARLLLACIVAIAGVVIPIIVIPLMFGALFAAMMAMMLGAMMGASTGGVEIRQSTPAPRMERSVPRPRPAAPATQIAADEPETVYRNFHDATVARDFAEMRKWGTASVGAEMAAAPAAQREAMIAFIGGMMPKTYTVSGKEISADGARATLHLSANVTDKGRSATVLGTATLLKEGGAWKVLLANWGGDQPPGPAPQAGAAAPRNPVAAAPEIARATPPAPADQPKAKARRSSSAAANAVPVAPVMRKGEAQPCIYKPVMTDEEMARCR